MDGKLPVLSKRIRELRLEKGLTQAELSALLGKKESTARMWEIGRSNPEYTALVEMSKYFDCTTDYLLGLTEFRNTKGSQALDEKFREFTEGKTQQEFYESEIVFDINKYILSAVDFYRDDFEFCLAFLDIIREISKGLYELSAQMRLTIIEKGKFDNYTPAQVKRYLAVIIARLGLMEKYGQENMARAYQLVLLKFYENIPQKYIPKSVELELDEMQKMFKEQLKL